MSPVREASLTAVREIRRNLGSTKGLAMFVLFLLGGLVVSLAQILLLRLASADGSQDIPEQALFEVVLLKTGAYDAATAKYLSACPWQIFSLFKGTLRFVPLLILIVSFDQIAGEIQHRGIRYVVGRSRRESFVAGKALGVWAVISTAVLVLHLVVWIVMLVKGAGSPAAIFAWGPRLWFFSSMAAAAWVGLITLVSSLFRTPMVALLVGVVVSFVLWLTNTLLELFPSTKAATWAFPFRYEELLLSYQPHQILGGVAASIGWGALMVLVATIIMKRRDV